MTKVTLIAGDGIGNEIAQSVKDVFKAAKVAIEWDEQACGLESLEECNQLLPDACVKSIKDHKIALKGPTTTPVGTGHRSVNVQLRQMFDLFANVRPIKSFEGLKCAHDEIDLVIVRENSEDLYKGIEYKVGPDTAHGIKLITRSASERIAKHAFELAKAQGKKTVTAVHKANIMKYTDGLFLEAFRDVAKSYPEIEANDCIIDNCCMQLVTKPQQFDVLVTENLYGDILSDLASGLIGGLGVASGANLGKDLAIFEAVHGSAPDIAGQNKANPTALLLSSVTMLKHMKLSKEAAQIENAIKTTLANPQTRTGDLGGGLSTTDFTAAIIDNL